MTDFLYRFRSIDALLGERAELERQEIYFCPPEQLNDPLEGFKNVVWRGDSIVWRNLLKHYLLCLTLSVSTFCILGDSFDPELSKDYAYGVPDDFKIPLITEIYPQICADFLSEESPNLLIATLGKPTIFVRRHGLSAYLRLIHPTALKVIFSALAKNDSRLNDVAASLGEHAQRITLSLAELLDHHARMSSQAEPILTISENLTAQIALIQDLQQTKTDLGWLFISRDFPDFHINALERMIYPAWYTACFVAEPTNASMWGVYGDGHKGACLIFRARRDTDDARSLDLHGISGWSMGRGDEAPNPMHAYVSHKFTPVRYANDYPEIDFFESLGTLRRDQLSGFWYAGENGERSKAGQRVLSESAEWRDDYWSRHGTATTTKLPEWSHEQEYRLVLSSSLSSFEDVSSRKFKYRLSDLAGIAFGIKTGHSEKLAIVRAMEKKASVEALHDFQFFQSIYSTETGKIELIPLNLLKMRTWLGELQQRLG